jgi:hypothetical protein
MQGFGLTAASRRSRDARPYMNFALVMIAPAFRCSCRADQVLLQLGVLGEDAPWHRADPPTHPNEDDAPGGTHHSAPPDLVGALSIRSVYGRSAGAGSASRNRDPLDPKSEIYRPPGFFERLGAALGRVAARAPVPEEPKNSLRPSANVTSRRWRA